MRSSSAKARSRWLPIAALCLLLAFGGTVWAENEDYIGEHPTGVPLRVRDLTFPNFLLLGFMPHPGASLGKGRWAAEVHYSVVNDFQVSNAIEQYLEQSRADGVRRELDLDDVAFIETLPEGDQFYVDGEFGLINAVFNYGVTDRLDLSLELNHLSYGGGDLDSGIEDFHDEFGFSQQGRNFVPQRRFQIIVGDTVILQRTTSGGLSDPILRLNYAVPGSVLGFTVNVGAGAKIAVQDTGDFLSTGGHDFGVSVSADRRWNRWGLVLQTNLISPGDFDEVEDFNPPSLVPTFDLVLLRSVGERRRTTLLLQLLTGENIFSDFGGGELLGGSELSDLAVQITAGVKHRRGSGVWGFGITENLFNMDSTVDVGFHLSWGKIFGSR